MKKAIIFDNDGVLVDTEKLYFQATSEIMAAAGRAITLEDFIECNIKSSKAVWHLLNGSPEEIGSLRARRNRRYTQLLNEQSPAIAGVDAVIEELRQHYRLCIVTTSRREHFDAIHRWTSYLQHFEFVITVDDVTHSKPHPEPYLKALQHLQLQAPECLVVEDSSRGLAAAKAAGIDCAVVKSVLSEWQDFSAADTFLESLAELPAFLRGL